MQWRGVLRPLSGRNGEGEERRDHSVVAIDNQDMNKKAFTLSLRPLRGRKTVYHPHGKRFLDISAASLSLLLLSPLLALLALLVRWRLGSPVLFRQQRPDLHGEPFKLFKFRTMTDARDSHGNLLPDVQRMTPFGRFLRRTSLDELPELWNVLKGQMSLVGPRPLLMEYLPLYSPAQARRHEVRPGITGWAQVNGRNAISWEERFKLDVWYVDNMTFLLDMKIIAVTFWKILKREGISASGEATMPRFTGSGSEAANRRDTQDPIA